jgi:hypothetical protein
MSVSDYRLKVEEDKWLAEKGLEGFDHSRIGQREVEL